MQEWKADIEKRIKTLKSASFSDLPWYKRMIVDESAYENTLSRRLTAA